METVIAILSTLGLNGILLFFIKRFFDKRDKEEAVRAEIKEAREKESAERYDEIYKKVENCLETIRLLSYSRMAEEINRLIKQGYATPAERHVLEEMHKNYKSHGWNGDMDEGLKRVYALKNWKE